MYLFITKIFKCPYVIVYKSDSIHHEKQQYKTFKKVIKHSFTLIALFVIFI